MNRPWTACAVMLITLGGTLGAVGSANRPADDRRELAGCRFDADRHIVFCDLPAAHGNARYEDGCGYDRATGVRYSQPAASRVWSMVAEQRFLATMEMLRSLKNGGEHGSASPATCVWPSTAVNIQHPAAPAFYNYKAARDYALAQGRAWRESSEPLMLRTARAGEPVPMLRLELCPGKTSLSWGFGNTAVHLNAVIRTIRHYPADHNARITVLALQNRTNYWIERLQGSNAVLLARGNGADYRKSAKAIGFEPGEYEELVDRALEKLPAPDKIESPPHFRPAPSRQKLLRMASVTLQQMSDLLDLTAAHLERAAGGEMATRQQRPASR